LNAYILDHDKNFARNKTIKTNLPLGKLDCKVKNAVFIFEIPITFQEQDNQCFFFYTPLLKINLSNSFAD